MRVTRCLAAIVIALVLVVDHPSAHSGLRFSSPLDGATLGDTPADVQLTFLERPEPSLSTIRVVDAAGAAWHDGPPAPVPGDPLSLTVRVRPLPKGVYTVHWRVVSSVDGHASAGIFAFGVLVAPAGVTASAAGVDTAAPPIEIVARWIFLAGLIVLLGAAAAYLARFGAGRELGVAGAGWMLSVAGLALLAFAQSQIAGAALGDFAGTAIGRALIWRTVAIAAAGAALAVAVHARRTVRPALIAGGMSGVALAACAAMVVHASAGHAGAGRSLLAATIAGQAVHFAAAGVWLGGLAALVAGVRGAVSESRTAAVQRFSSVAAIGLVVVLLTGIARAATELSGWNDLVATPYGRVLAAKVALMAGIAALGAWNRWRNVPRAAASLQPLRRAGFAELVLTAAALAAAAALGTLAPPAAVQAIAGIDASGSDFATTIRARLTAASNHPGPNRFVVHLADYDSRAPVRADRVTLRFTPTDDPGVAPTSLALAPGGGDAFAGSGANVRFDGRWGVGVLIERAGSSVEVPLEIETSSAPQQVSVEPLPNGLSHYTVYVSRLGLVRFSPDRARPGRSQVVVTCFDVLGGFRRMEQMVVTAVTVDGVRRQQPVRRLDPHRFAAEIELRPGSNSLVAVAQAAEGIRMRAAVTFEVMDR